MIQASNRAQRDSIRIKKRRSEMVLHESFTVCKRWTWAILAEKKIK